MRSFSDAELLRRLRGAIRQTRGDEVGLITLIAEVDARKLYAREARPSMFLYCTEVLHLSEQEAYLRITVARASREHPCLLAMVRDGRLHLSGIARLTKYLTRENREEVLKRAVHKSRRELEKLVAEMEPCPDVPPAMRRLPTRRAAPSSAPSDAIEAQRAGSLVAGSARPARVKPLAPARYKVEFTASAELHDKLLRLQALMRSSVPDGDLARIIDEAVTEKLERLEARRFAKTSSPRKSLAETDTIPGSRHIPAAVRRAVYARDRGRCTYQDARGRRCPARDRLEFHHHRQPFGRGGEHSVYNIRLMCRAHNQLLAELDYGEEKMARYRRSANRVSEPEAVYSLGTRGARDPSGRASV